jgi:hypothetical protein
MPTFERLMRALLARGNARRLGVHGAIPPGSTVSRRGQGLDIGASFFAIALHRPIPLSNPQRPTRHPRDDLTNIEASIMKSR